MSRPKPLNPINPKPVNRTPLKPGFGVQGLGCRLGVLQGLWLRLRSLGVGLRCEGFEPRIYNLQQGAKKNLNRLYRYSQPALLPGNWNQLCGSQKIIR